MNNENKLNQNESIIDISSVSEKYKARKEPIEAFGNGVAKNLGNIVKVISFILAFGILILSLILAFFIISKSILSIAICLAIILFGAIFAAIVFYPIYGIGHLICQNDEILRRLK